MNPRAGLDDVEKRKFLTIPGLEIRPLSVQPVASGCYPVSYFVLNILQYSSSDTDNTLLVLHQIIRYPL
jgi:hypothetical protein